jgi:hypothetical protein
LLHEAFAKGPEVALSAEVHDGICAVFEGGVEFFLLALGALGTGGVAVVAVVSSMDGWGAGVCSILIKLDRATRKVRPMAIKLQSIGSLQTVFIFVSIETPRV